jgi:ABC-type branched-subunit amino acid transport system substrate-binding protein
MDRRDFLTWSSLAGLTAIRQRGPVVRIVLLTPPGAPTFPSEMGIRMSVEEVERAVLLFGGEIKLTRVTGDARVAATADEVESIVNRERTTAILGGAHAAECAALARVADRQGALYFNISSSEDALRGAECRPTMFHVIPSAAMCRDALARAELPAEADARCVAWDASLVRFGADTLNQRFQTRYGQPMTDESWTGWLAVKMLWESALRARTAEPRALAAVLTRDSTRFDGHKGRALSFRPWDHQLRQPVYVFSGGSGASRPVEVPVASAANVSSTVVLDELGVSADRTPCRWSR